jgi:hypothetical protein
LAVGIAPGKDFDCDNSLFFVGSFGNRYQPTKAVPDFGRGSKAPILFEWYVSLAINASNQSTDDDRSTLAFHHQGEHSSLDRFRSGYLTGNYGSFATDCR